MFRYHKSAIIIIIHKKETPQQSTDATTEGMNRSSCVIPWGKMVALPAKKHGESILE